MILQVVSAESRSLGRCLSTYIDDLPGRSGTLHVSLTVGSAGQVLRASSELGDRAVGHCVEAVAGSLQFPRHVDPSVSLRLPIKYRKRRIGPLPGESGPASQMSAEDLAQAYLVAHQVPPDWIRSMLNGNRSTFEDCARREASPWKGTRSLTLGWNSSPDGAVGPVRVLNSEVDERTETCFRDVLSSWRFPPTGNGEGAGGRHSFYFRDGRYVEELDVLASPEDVAD